MNTLRMLSVGVAVAAVASLSVAADEPAETTLTTITVTAKRPMPAPAVERVAPQAAIDAVLLIGDMPETEIDNHVTPIASPVVAVPQRTALTLTL